MEEKTKNTFYKIGCVIILILITLMLYANAVMGASITFYDGKSDKDILSGKIVKDDLIGLTAIESAKVIKVPYEVSVPQYKETCNKITTNGSTYDDCIQVLDKPKIETYYKSAQLVFDKCKENKNYQIYKSDLFYSDSKDIIKNGYPYKVVKCVDNKLTFDVESFSAYTYGELGHAWARDMYNTSIVYVKVNLTAGTTYSFSITNISNYSQQPNDVFLLYDDFEDASINQTKWNLSKASSYGETGGYMYVSSGSNTNFIYSNITFFQNASDTNNGILVIARAGGASGNPTYVSLSLSVGNTLTMSDTSTNGTELFWAQTGSAQNGQIYLTANSNGNKAVPPASWINIGTDGNAQVPTFIWLRQNKTSNSRNNTNWTNNSVIGNFNGNMNIKWGCSGASCSSRLYNISVLKKYVTEPTISCVNNLCSVSSTINLTDYQIPLITTYTSEDVNITDLPVVNMSFMNQTPSDISSVNILNQSNLTIYYNITGYYNLSSPILYYKTNDSTSDNLFYVNGVNYGGWMNISYVSNTSGVYDFRLYDTQVYPATYNRLNMDIVPNTNFLNQSNSNDYLAVELLNVSNTKEYGFFEYYGNGTGTNRIYYCNSSYNFNSNVNLNSNCILLSTIDGNTYSHTHPSTSHILVPFAVNTTTGKIGNVNVTSKSYFMIRDSNRFYGLLNVSRINNTRYSTNNGLNWNVLTYEMNAHLHQYLGNSKFYYKPSVQANIDSKYYNGSLREDLIDLYGLPPNAPIVSIPISDTYSGVIPITFSEAESPNNYAISFYNVTLINNATLSNTTLYDNSVNTIYNWDSTAVSDGYYYLRITAVDNVSQTSYSESEVFQIDNSVPGITFIAPTPADSSTITTSSFIVNVSLIENNFKNITYYLYFATGILDSTQFYDVYTTNHTFIGLLNGVAYKFNVSSCDAVDNCNISETRTITYSATSPTGNGTTIVTINSTPYLNLSFSGLNSCPNSQPQVILFLGILFALMVVFGFGYKAKSILFMLTPALAFMGLSFIFMACLEFFGIIMLAFGILLIPMAFIRGRHI
jgi:hypothetical protein